TGASTSPSLGEIMIPRLRAALVGGLAFTVLAFVPLPARAASKELERLMIQVGNLQSQVAELQRTIGENAQESRRLSDVVGEQTATFKKVLQDQKLQDEALNATLKELSDRVADVSAAAAAPRAAAVPVGAPGEVPADGSAPAVPAA